MNRWGKSLLYTYHLVFVGLCWMGLAGAPLASQRWPASVLVRWMTIIVLLVGFVWLVLRGFPKLASDQTEQDRRDDALAFPVAITLGVLMFFRTQDWAVVAMGITYGASQWTIARWHGRIHLLAAGGWILGGIAAVRLGWPGEQKWELLFLIGGASTVVQGLLDAPALRRTLKSHQSGTSAVEP